MPNDYTQAAEKAQGMIPLGTAFKRCPETRAHYQHEWYSPLRQNCPGGPDETVQTVQHGIARGSVRIEGRCPTCGVRSLFVGQGGYVTCGWLDCSDPCAPSKALGVDFSKPDPTDPTDLRVPSFERVTHIDFGESANPTPPGQAATHD